MTLKEIRQEIREELIESSEEIWTDAELNDYINDGFAVIQQAAQWKENLENGATNGSSFTGVHTADIQNIRRVTFDREFLPQVSEFDLDRHKANWREDAADTPVRWYYLNNQATPDNIRLYPPASAATDTYDFNQDEGVIVRVQETGDTWTFNQNEGVVLSIIGAANEQFLFRGEQFFIEGEFGEIQQIQEDVNAVGIWYVSDIPELLFDADIPDLPKWTHPVVVWYALFRCFERAGAFQDEQLSLAYLNEFVEWMQAVVHIRNRQFPDRVFSLDAVVAGNNFHARLSRFQGYNVLLGAS